tara:strand:+ start:219 stop:377 length:159 start_codon:yes stop_codon:yes gene_type:complete
MCGPGIELIEMIEQEKEKKCSKSHKELYITPKNFFKNSTKEVKNVRRKTDSN